MIIPPPLPVVMNLHKLMLREQGSLGEEMHFSYEVFQGGFLDVDVAVVAMKNDRKLETIFEKSRSTKGKTKWEVLDDLEYEIWYAAFAAKHCFTAHSPYAYTLLPYAFPVQF